MVPEGRVTLPPAVEAVMVAHARETAPAECCGLLLGTPGAIVEARPARNVASDATRRYQIDPVEHLAAIREARGRQLEVVGVYHSHPGSPAHPSTTDAAEAFSHFLFVIVGLAAGRADVQGWQWHEGNFMPVPLVRVE